MYNKIKLSLFGHAITQRSYWYITWLYFGYHVLFFSIYFVCTCFFVDKYLCDVLYLEKFIHTRDDTSLIDILFLRCSPFICSYFFGGSAKEFVYECLFYFIASSRTHIWFRHNLWFYLHLIELVFLFAIHLISSFNPVCCMVMLSNIIHWRLCWCSMLILV
jgi:hypothetical protein